MPRLVAPSAIRGDLRMHKVHVQKAHARVAGFAVLAAGFGFWLTGCSSDSNKAPTADNSTAEETDAKSGASPAPQADQPFVLGNAVAAFNPPTLEDLDKLTWRDSPVLDGLEILRGERVQQGAPEVSAEEALRLRNDSPENNRKILDALGVLAPADERAWITTRRSCATAPAISPAPIRCSPAA